MVYALSGRSAWCLCAYRCLKDCDYDARAVVRDMNGPLLERLLQKYGYHDRDCVSVFQKGVLSARVRIVCLNLFFRLSVAGARLMGVVEPCGLGDSIDHGS